MTTLLSETLRADIAEEVKGLIMMKKSKLNVMCFEWDASPPLVELSIVWSVAGVKCLVTLVELS